MQWAYHLILPWITFAILFAALYVRMIRANVMETLNEDYVRTARAKGAPEWLVLRSHVLRNAMLPIVTMLGMDIGLALGGAIFTETRLRPARPRAAADPGDQQLRPARSTMGLVVFATTAIIIFNLVVDLLYAWHRPADPALPDGAARGQRPPDVLPDRRRRRQGRRRRHFTVEKGQTLGIVGESGCGKSVTCLTIMGLNPRQNTMTSAARRCSKGATC